MMENYTFRLKSAQDLFDSIESFGREKHIEAGCALSRIGSLACFAVRLSDRDIPTEYEGHFEIVSLAGTISIHGSHLHISVSDAVRQWVDPWFQAAKFIQRPRLCWLFLQM